MVPGRSRSRWTQWTSSQSSAGPGGASRAPASRSTGPSATWMCTPTPRSAARLGGRLERVVAAREGGVHADHPPTAGAQEALVLGQPAAGAVGPVAVGDAVGARRPARRPRRTRRRSRRGCRRWRSGDSWWSTMAVVPHSSASSAPSMADHRIISRSRAASRRHQTCSRISMKSVGEPGRRRHAPRQRRVEVVVAADEPGTVGRRVTRRRRVRRAARHRAGVVRHSPSRSCSAAATAPGRGHQADLADALDAVRRVRLGRLDEDHVDRGHVLGSEDAEASAASCWWGRRSGVGGEVLGQRVARGPCAPTPSIWPSHSSGLTARPTSWAATHPLDAAGVRGR